MARLWRLLLLILVPMLALAPAVRAETGAKHVRVVLDTSLSMSRRLGDGTGPNDPGRLAVLATMLLYDLVDPNPRHHPHPDSFQVLPFDHWDKWTDPARNPPGYTGRYTITATGQDTAEHAAFESALKALRYDAPNTYFSPGLEAALASLPQHPPPDDRLVIVLVTDGLPEREVKAREAELLRELRERLLARGVRFYVLAFGPRANAERAFFDALFAGDEGRQLGEIFVDPDGRDLVLNMARIFSRGFGYMVERIGIGPRVRPVDLDGDVTPPKVAVVALRRGGPSPRQNLVPSVTAPRGLMAASETGAAYSVQMIEGVDPHADYRLETDSDQADIAILRQVIPDLKLLPGYVEHDTGREPMNQVRRVVAETDFVLKVLVRSPTGTRGPQAKLDISFRTLGSVTGPCKYWPDWGWHGSDPGSRQTFGEGETYDIHVRFPAWPSDPGNKYQGFVSVDAKFKPEGSLVARTVGKLECDTAHEFEVYPKIAIRTLPPDGFLNPPALRRAQHGCAAFELRMDDPAKLAVLGPGPYRLSAYVEPSVPALKETAFAGAGYALDGEMLGYADAGTSWSSGRALTREQLLGPHELCVTAGEPRGDAPNQDLDLRVHFKLLHTPYDDFRAVEPFLAKVRMVPEQSPLPTRFDWRVLWPVLLPLLAALLAALLLIPRLPLPEDLGYSLVPEDGEGGEGGTGAAPLIRRLDAPNLLARLLGLSPPRPLQDPGSDRILAWIKPLERTLFGLRPNRGIIAMDTDGRALAPERGLAEVGVRTDYRLIERAPRPDGTRGRWRLRIGYQRAP